MTSLEDKAEEVVQISDILVEYSKRETEREYLDAKSKSNPERIDELYDAACQTLKEFLEGPMEAFFKAIKSTTPERHSQEKVYNPSKEILFIGYDEQSITISFSLKTTYASLSSSLFIEPSSIKFSTNQYRNKSSLKEIEEPLKRITAYSEPFTTDNAKLRKTIHKMTRTVPRLTEEMLLSFAQLPTLLEPILTEQLETRLNEIEGNMTYLDLYQAGYTDLFVKYLNSQPEETQEEIVHALFELNPEQWKPEINNELEQRFPELLERVGIQYVGEGK